MVELKQCFNKAVQNTSVKIVRRVQRYFTCEVSDKPGIPRGTRVYCRPLFFMPKTGRSPVIKGSKKIFDDSKKMNEEEFEKKLLNTLSHFASRKGWKYMGTWERGKDTDRLHFHAIMHIPEGTMSGELVRKREYDVKKKRMVERIENTFFEKKYGRNTFEFVDGTALTVNTAIEYIVKYLEKDGGRIICSKGLHTFLETDIDNKDIVCRLRAGEDKKYILFDDFKVYKDGKELGTISPGVLASAKTVE